MESTNYSTLNRQRLEIRLLTIQPGYQGSPLECVLHTASLLGRAIPRYETMSYCWGDASSQTVMRLNGDELPITTQVSYVLSSARRTYVPRVIWIDSICINQADEHEQAQQVAMMAEIYQRSVGNLICLGTSDDRALEDRKTRQALFDISAPLQNQRPEMTFSESMPRLYSSRWFERLWVIQECLLAPSNTVLLDGLEIDLGHILDVSMRDRLQHSSVWESLDRASHLRYLAAINLWEWMNYAPRLRMQAADSPAMILSMLLDSFGSLSCTRLHDKVYALLGVFKDLAALQQLPLALQPDYRQDPILVILKAIRYVLLEHGRLQINTFLVHRSPIGNLLPSWARDWTYIVSTKQKNEEAAFLLDHSSLPACGRGLLRIKNASNEEMDSHILCLEGVPLGHLEQLTDTSDGYSFSWAYFPEIMQLQVDTGLSDLQLAETLTAGFNARGEPASHDDLAMFKDYCRQLRRWRHEESEDDGASSRDPEPETSERRAQTFRMAMDAACGQRRLFTTDKSHLAVGPRTAIPGDELAILAACEMPVVLRQESNGMYRLIGPAYVSGIMHGEAVVAHLDAGQTTKVYDLI